MSHPFIHSHEILISLLTNCFHTFSDNTKKKARQFDFMSMFEQAKQTAVERSQASAVGEYIRTVTHIPIAWSSILEK